MTVTVTVTVTLRSVFPSTRLHRQFPVQHPLVERHREAGVDELAVVQGHGDEPTWRGG